MLTKYPIQFYGLIIGLITLTSITITANTPQILPILLALLVFTHIQAVLLAPLLAGPLGLVTISLWILARSQFGVWSEAYYLESLLEVSLLGLNTLLAIQFRRVWHKQRGATSELKSLHNVLSVGQSSNGLLSADVGKLRLIEEVDRAAHFRRPVALIILEVIPRSDELPPTLQRAVFQAVVRRLNTMITAHDIPYRLRANTIAVIMPERGWDTLYDEAEHIEQSLRQTPFSAITHLSDAIEDYMDLRFGLSVYENSTQTVESLLENAERSLVQHRNLADAVAAYETMRSAESLVTTEVK